MNAPAPGAPAQEPLLASGWAADHSGAELGPDETSLSFEVRLRHGLIGLALGIAALLLAVALGVWLVSAIFHTAPGALA